MRFADYRRGRYWDFVFVVTGSGDPGRCEALEDMARAKRDGKFKQAKLDAKIERLVEEPEGLSWLSELGDHPAHSACIEGYDIDFWGIAAGNYRLYAFQWGSSCVIAAAFATKKTQTTSKQHREACEATARRVIQASGRRGT